MDVAVKEKVSMKPTFPQIKTTKPRKDREKNPSYLKALEGEQAYRVEKVTKQRSATL